MKLEFIKETKRIDLKNLLYEKLNNKIFHITTPIGYKGILKDKAIHPSNHPNIKRYVWGFSEKGRYFTNLNCISVIDFYHNKNKKLLKEASRKYHFYDMNSVAKNQIGYLFVLKKHLYDKVITWEMAKKDIIENNKHGEQIVPNLESGIKNKILLSDIESIIKIKMMENN